MFSVCLFFKNVLSKLSIKNATCIVHFDLSKNTKSFGKRLWLMRAHFGKQVGTAELNERQHNKSPEEYQGLCSYVFFRPKSINDRSHALELSAYLSRIGKEDKYLPKGFLRTVEECKRELEQDELRHKLPLCPFLKVKKNCFFFDKTSEFSFSNNNLFRRMVHA